MKQVCPSIGADSVMQIVVERPNAPGNFFAFDACFKGPGVDAERSEAMAIFNSARFKG
jgi:hypothetical protein